MNPNKRFKTLNGFWTNISPVKEGKKNHNYAEGLIQTGTDNEEKVLFFFQKPSLTSTVYENALNACRAKQSTMVSSLTEDSDGKFLASRTTEVKQKNVTFERRKSADEQTIHLGTINDNGPSSNEDIITISGCLIKLDEQVNIKKFDNSLQKMLDKKYRTGILANATGAVIIMLWENLSDEIKENDNLTLRNMRRSIDGNGQLYFTTTFRTEYTNTNNESDDFDEESVTNLIGIRITLFKSMLCTVDSILIDMFSICPRCKTKSTSNENIATCTNTMCGATFKTKTKSVKADLIVTKIDDEKQHNLVAYKDLLFGLIGNTDKNTITNYFMANDNKFNITYHCRSNVIEKIEKIR